MYLHLPGERHQRSERDGLAESLGECRASRGGGCPQAMVWREVGSGNTLLPAWLGTALPARLGRKMRNCSGPRGAHVQPGWEQRRWAIKEP